MEDNGPAHNSKLFYAISPSDFYLFGKAKVALIAARFPMKSAFLTHFGCGIAA
jgi:hypothetical protein